jgi:hypothetical protein
VISRRVLLYVVDKIVQNFYLIGFARDFPLWAELSFEQNHQFSNIK